MVEPRTQTTLAVGRGASAAIVLLAGVCGVLWWTMRPQPAKALDASRRVGDEATLSSAEQTVLVAATEMAPAETPPRERAEVVRSLPTPALPRADAERVGATITGRLEDRNGHPIARRAVWRREAEGAWRVLFESHEDPLESTLTDADGRFAFDAVPKGTWWIGPAPESDDLPALAEAVPVKRVNDQIEIVLLVDRGLYIRGRVLDPAGVLMPDCVVVATALDIRTHVLKKTDDLGAFAFGPLPAGTWTLEAGWIDDEHAESEPIDCAAGTDGVVLRLRAGGSIVGEVVDAATGGRRKCTLCLSPRDAVDQSGWFVTGSNHGAIDFRGVLPGTYVVIAQGDGGLIGMSSAQDVMPGAQTDGVRVELAEGARLELIHEGSHGPVWCAIHVDGVFCDAAFVSAIGTGARIVPAGAIELRWCERGNPERPRTEKVSLRAGESRKVALRARP